MSLNNSDIVVLGGGVIGLSIALRMLHAGREVVLIDPEAVSYTHLTLPTKA